MKNRFFSSKIVEWYAEHRRPLPWRNTRDAYKIWLSEIILQQTRVLQGLPYYKKFIRHYPTIKLLASAREQDILGLWQGLGYYSRARNLHKCAREVVRRYGAKFPRSFEELKTLPGVGDYTAAAIASFAFGEQVAVVDGNVFRVLARLFGVDKNISSTQGRKTFASLANELIPSFDPGLHNQAVMEFGALHCLPRNPKCESCIFKKVCFANQHGQQQQLPVKSKPKKTRHRYFYYLVARQGAKVLMTKRTKQDIWNGLFNFPLHEERRRVSAKRILTLLFPSRGMSSDKSYPEKISREYKHVLSHQVIHARFVELQGGEENGPPISNLLAHARFYSTQEIARLPKPVLISRYLLEEGVL